MKISPLPHGYEFYFYEDTLPREWVPHLKKAMGTYVIMEDVPHSHFEGKQIKLDRGYFPDEYILAEENERDLLDIEDEVNAFLQQQSVDVWFVREAVTHSFQPRTFLIENEWMSILFDHTTDTIAAFYRGSYDPYLSLANHANFLEIHPLYQRKGLCVPFVERTFYKILERVKILKVMNATKPGIIGCKCYTRAAENIGANAFLHNKKINSTECLQQRANDFITITYQPTPTL